MVLENKAYVPTLAVRASEMNGLEYLPGATKDRMTPCFLLAPWANSNSLERTITRIERAYPNRPYFLDLDRNYQLTKDQSLVQREFAALSVATNDFENWVRFVNEHEMIYPCIQTLGQTEVQIRRQIASFQNIGRPYCLRASVNPFPSNLSNIVSAFAAGGTADFAIILEGGWTTDPLTLSAQFSGIITNGLGAIDATVPIVLSCTSMPKVFSTYSSPSPTPVPFNNRQLVSQIAQQSNRAPATIKYGDWGSTRPRESGGFANRPLDRVDYPTDQIWYIARNKEAEWDFRDAARVIIASPHWDGSLGIWGEEMIQQTTINEELGIDSPQKNVAARVNIHLHRQAFFGQPRAEATAFDEDWQD